MKYALRENVTLLKEVFKAAEKDDVPTDGLCGIIKNDTVFLESHLQNQVDRYPKMYRKFCERVSW